MRDSGALTELLLTRCTEKLRFPPQEAYGEATGITPWSARSIIWPMYARPIRISRGVIPGVRSCSCPDGWLREINGSGTAERGCTDRSPIELTRSVSHGERALLAIRGLPQVQARLEALNPGIANAAGRIGKHGTTRPDDPASVFADIRARCDPESGSTLLMSSLEISGGFLL